MSKDKYEEKIVDGIVEAIKAAKLTPEQVRIFGNAFSRALGCEPLTQKEIEDARKNTIGDISGSERNLKKEDRELSEPG